MREGYADFSVSNRDLLADRFSDFSAFIDREAWPAVIEGIGFREHIFLRNLIDFQHIDLALEAWKFLPKLL